MLVWLFNMEARSAASPAERYYAEVFSTFDSGGIRHNR
jgi:hypothetical protein